VDGVTIAGYASGTPGRVAERHARYCGKGQGVGLSFEAKAAAGLAEFLRRFNPERDGFWTVSR